MPTRTPALSIAVPSYRSSCWRLRRATTMTAATRIMCSVSLPQNNATGLLVGAWLLILFAIASKAVRLGSGLQLGLVFWGAPIDMFLCGICSSCTGLNLLPRNCVKCTIITLVTVELVCKTILQMVQIYAAISYIYEVFDHTLYGLL